MLSTFTTSPRFSQHWNNSSLKSFSVKCNSIQFSWSSVLFLKIRFSFDLVKNQWQRFIHFVFCSHLCLWSSLQRIPNLDSPTSPKIWERVKAANIGKKIRSNLRSTIFVCLPALNNREMSPYIQLNLLFYFQHIGPCPAINLNVEEVYHLIHDSLLDSHWFIRETIELLL